MSTNFFLFFFLGAVSESKKGKHALIMAGGNGPLLNHTHNPATHIQHRNKLGNGGVAACLPGPTTVLLLVKISSTRLVHKNCNVQLRKDPMDGQVTHQ